MWEQTALSAVLAVTGLGLMRLPNWDCICFSLGSAEVARVSTFAWACMKPREALAWVVARHNHYTEEWSRLMEVRE